MKPRGSAGFTLIELVVTVAIVSLLATMAMPLTQLVIKRGREQDLRASLREIRDALDHYNELWRYSCQAAINGAGGAGSPLPGALQQPIQGNGFGQPGAAGQTQNKNGAFGSFGAAGTGGTAGSVGGAGLGGSGGLNASTVQGVGGADGKGGITAPPPPPPKMECPTASTGWPKDLQTLVDGVNNITSPVPGAKIYFLRRIPRDPMNPDATVAADLTWGKRSYSSPADDPQEGDDVYDVYSLSTANDLTGKPYREW